MPKTKEKCLHPRCPGFGSRFASGRPTNNIYWRDPHQTHIFCLLIVYFMLHRPFTQPDKTRTDACPCTSTVWFQLLHCDNTIIWLPVPSVFFWFGDKPKSTRCIVIVLSSCHHRIVIVFPSGDFMGARRNFSREGQNRADWQNRHIFRRAQGANENFRDFSTLKGPFRLQKESH